MNTRYLYSIAISAILAITSACSLADATDNPNESSTPVYVGLLNNVQAHLGVRYTMEENVQSLRAGLYAQYFSETQYTDASRYSDPLLPFSNYYNEDLHNLQDIINNSGNNNLTQVAIILQQYIYYYITNHWGDVPYSEALQGPGLWQPRYDTQESIYRGIFQKLGDAVEALDDSPITGGDLIYAGNIDAWRRMANSLKLIAALQLSKRVPSEDGFAAQAFREALVADGGVITNNSQNFQITYPGGFYQNPYFLVYLTRGDYGQSESMTNLMAALNDQRQSVFGGASNAPGVAISSNLGVPHGLERADALDFINTHANWARILRGDKRTATSPLYFITAAQVSLARAEAADLGWTTESASAAYQQGIALSFAQWDVPFDASYLNQAAVSLEAPGSNLEKISVQRYIAAYPDGAQGWNIWRKSGFPRLEPAPAALSPTGQIPRRYVYDLGEFTSNEANVQEAISRLPGGNTLNARVWWDVVN